MIQGRIMSEKSRIVAALGESRLLLPALLNRALAANDRAKYRLTLLQSAKGHADMPGEAFPGLRAERLVCGVAEAEYDDVIAGTVKHGADTYAVPQARSLCSGLRDDLSAMIEPFDSMGKTEAESFRRRLQTLSGGSWCGDDDTISGAAITSLASGDPEHGDSIHGTDVENIQ